MRSPLLVEKFEPVTIGPSGPLHLTNWGWRQVTKEARRRGKLPPMAGGSGQFSSFVEQAALNHLTGQDNAAWLSLNTQFLALCTVVPTSSSTGSTLTEASYTGYARLDISGWGQGASGAAPATGATGGPRAPATVATAAGGGVAWSFPSLIQNHYDVGPATTAALNNSSSNALVSSAFGLSIPSSAVITGIQVQFARQASVGGAGSLQTLQINLTKVAGTPVGSNLAAAGNWTTGVVVETYGGPTNLWGTTWTPTDVNSSGFGTYLIATDGVVASTASVYNMLVTVYYTLAFASCTGGSSTVIAVARCTASSAGNVLGWTDVPSTVISATQTPAVLAAYSASLT